MKTADVLKAPFRAARLATGEKSFAANPVLASPRLNRMGLHVARVALAERMADRRRRSLARLVAPEDREAFARDGFVVRENVLAPDDFQRLSDEVEAARLPAYEMRQGNAVTRFIPLPPEALAPRPELARFVRGGLFQGLMRYVAGIGGDPIVYLHTVLTEPGAGRPDPQTAFHSDTFHPTAKAWYFLRDVEEADGPFTYIPGSHRLTPGRRAWEQAQSETALSHPSSHHRSGSFRASAEEIAEMGFGAPRVFAVPANTLVTADTHGFHARGPALRPSVRVGLYGSLRRAPFLPVTGLDLMRLPGLDGRKAQLFVKSLEWRARLGFGASNHPYVGDLAPGDPKPRI